MGGTDVGRQIVVSLPVLCLLSYLFARYRTDVLLMMMMIAAGIDDAVFG